MPPLPSGTTFLQPWLAALRRRWWLLPFALGLAGSLLLLRRPGRPPRPVAPAPASPRPAPRPAPRPRGPGVVVSPLGSEEHIAALGDFDGDGRLDVALTNGDPDSGPGGTSSDPQGSVTIWLGDGRGGLRHGPVLRGLEATLLAALDADGDGDTDLLAASCCQDSLLLWRNEGRGRLVPQPIALGTSATDLAVGDVDGDGDPDLVVPDYYRLQIGLNDGHGHFSWHPQAARTGELHNEDQYERVALADVNGDHDLDLVSPLGKGSILLNDGHGHFGPEQRLYGWSGYSLAIGDLNGDGRPDLVSGEGSGSLSVLLNDGTGHYGAPNFSQTLPNHGDGPDHWVALGDVDRDGDLDVVANAGRNNVWVYLNDGTAQFEPAYHAPTRPAALEELHLADLDYDGWLDILSPIDVDGTHPARRAFNTLRPPTGHEYYQQVNQMPTAVGGGDVQAAVDTALQRRLVLPPGYAISPGRPASGYVVEFVVGKDGAVEEPELSWKVTPSTDSLMLDALRHLRLAPGRLHGQPVRVKLRIITRLTGQGPPQADPPAPLPGEEPIYRAVEQPPTLADGRPVLPWLREQALSQLIVPDGEQLPPGARLVVELVVEKNGDVQGYRPLEGISPDVDGMLTGNLGNIPPLVPGRHHGRPVRVALRLVIEPHKGPPLLTQAAAGRLEARTRRQGQARRHPGESDAAFVHRVLPLALAASGHLHALAWRPGAFGQQLLVAIRGTGDNEYGTDLLVLDPYRPLTYGLRVLRLEALGDRTGLEALLVADVNHDGRPELLAVTECSLRETLYTDKHGQGFTGHAAHYATNVFRLVGTDRAGRPRYQPDLTPRPYLDELATAAAVRQALAHHRRQRK